MRLRLLLTLFLLIIPVTVFAWKQDFVRALKNGGAYVESERGTVLFDYQSQKHFMPASTIKIATAACAIQQLGLDYRFSTDFFLTPNKELLIRGYGDPFLISEEINLIAKELIKRGLRTVNGIILDPSYFDPGLKLDGRSASLNPYDALNGALVANFNTVYVLKDKSGQIESAEPQTPLTPIAHEVAKNSPIGKHRVNLGTDPETSSRYVGELLASFLKRYAVDIPPNIPIRIEETEKKLKLFYRHRSSKSLVEVIRGLLKFSTNFMANQLYLVMGANKFAAPATLDKAQKVFQDCLQNHIGWSDFVVIEGAGLSRHNRVTARQMMQLLRKFQKHRNLLPLEKKVFRAKTGTLTGVNTLAGYFSRDNGELIRFVLLVNSPVPHDYKFRLAKQLYQAVR